MEESVRYYMEYMPKARKGSHKRGKFTTNKKGTRYILSNLQYEQVRKWLLQHCPQNAKWEATSWRNKLLITASLGKYLKWITLISKKWCSIAIGSLIGDKVNGCVVDPETNLVFVNLGKFQGKYKENDEPFICASEASQVFYYKDPTRDNWYVVLDAPKRLNQGVDAFEDPLVFEARMSEEEMISELVNDIVEEVDTIDGSWV
ncbi:hypothetical protein IFM89_023364 [Coptis chinensis]|uniref:DUF4216 domain-containing protein n=1 Tax=Coptis chinensis TaxID=261450 RepID=A0A835HDP8_9MAGN|nr:hypothetical protein IFM89_023364 [Coptis chinensis]